MTPAKIPAELRETSLVVPIDSVTPAKQNPRRGDIPLIRESLRKNGQYRAIVVNKKTGEVLAGNHTWRAAKEEGWTEIAISYVAVSPAAAKRIVLVDNVANDKASWDAGELADYLRDLPDYTGTGFTPTDVDKLLAEDAARMEDPPAPPPPKRAKTKPGDVIRLGRHTLVCADARDQAAWDALPGPVDLLWTDPPYGVEVAAATAARRGRQHKAMKGDERNEDALQLLLTTVLNIAQAAARPGCPIYLCHADTMRRPVEQAMTDAGWRYSQTIIWVKDSLVIGRQDYQWRHEVLLYGWKPGADRPWLGQRNQSTIVEGTTRSALEALEHEDLVEIAWRLLEERPGTIVRFGKVRDQGDHPTPKPVDLVAKALRNSSEAGALVCDPFCGSGTTVLAAEQSDRTAYAVELEPGYCDVIVQRWEEISGEKAERPKRAAAKKRTPARKK